MDERDIEQLYQTAAQNAASKFLKAALRLGWRVFKLALRKVIPALLSWLGPVLVPLLAGLLIFAFVYFAVFMLPKYIITGGSSLEEKTVGIMRVVATGYTADYESTGKRPGDPGFGITATGVKAQRGVIAVDPTVIPFGTRMYVPGYGYGIALDTGGAIKGEKIDLFFDTAEEARQWGRRWVTIQLLGKGDIPEGEFTQANVAILSFGESDKEWPLAKDLELYRKYMDLDSDWLSEFQSKGELNESPVDSASGNAADSDATVEDVWGSWLSRIPSEKEQVDPHRVPWSLLGALDKVIGDPVVHGDYGLESEGHGRKPNPGRHFKELKPSLKWQTFELYYYHEWTVETEEGTETYTEEYTKKIKLLTSAECYDAAYRYSWGEEVIERRTENSYLKVIIPKSQGFVRTGPYYERLKKILESYDLKSEIDLETTLRIAETLDDTFYVDSWLFGTPLEITLDTEISAEFSGEKFPFWPCSGSVTSPFGMRLHPILKEVRMHTGIDISAPYGSDVVSVKDGIVVFTGVMGAYGNCVLVEHGDCRTLYGHLSRIEVSPGQKVSAGEKIGEVGSTGWSTGPHLHFEVRVGKGRTQYVDPETVLP